jgi:FKBP-type peptidyl-prolyl cis-trans isomerase
MATSTAQRTGIWIIAVVLTVGTLAGFIAMILAPQNEAADSARLEKAYAEYQTAVNDAEKKKSAQQTALDGEAEALSNQYFAEFNTYASRVGTFDKDKAQEKLVVEDLKNGTGEEIGESTTYAVYYIGWLPDGTIFDGSIDGSKLKSPFIARPNGTIAGWSEGAKGMKIGGVRQLTIPSEQGYGSAGQGTIPADTPLRFVLMPFRKLETINEPEIPQEILQSYGG